jgi:hypothetical protein
MPDYPPEYDDPEPPECATCRYWQTGVTTTSGQCRFNPPTLVMRQQGAGVDYLDSRWPKTSSVEWCGKWEEIV